MHGEGTKKYSVLEAVGSSERISMKIAQHHSSTLLSCIFLAALLACTQIETSPIATSEQAVEPTLPLIVASPNPSAGTLCADLQPVLITEFEVYAVPSLPEPVARVPFRDPVFGTCLVRVTDRNTDLSPDDPSRGLKNEYSRVQSFNANQSLILARGIAATWYVYNAQTLKPMKQVPLGEEPRWDAADPNRIYYTEETRLLAFDLSTSQVSLIHDFAGDFPGQTLSSVWTRYEGSPSADTRYWGLMAEDENWLTAAFLIYDRQTDKVVATRDIRGWSEIEREIDSVTISPLGDYFLAYLDDYCPQGQLGTEDDPCGLMIYDRTLSQGRGLLRIVGHSDTALDAQGREVLIYQDIDTDSLAMLDLRTGIITPLWPIDFNHTAIGLHISGRALRTPGWAVISTHDGDPASYTWMDDQVFLIELKAGGRVVRLVHTHSLVDENQEHDYWAEPHASASWDLTHIVFTTNWERSGTEEVEVFLIDLPSDWAVQLPK